MIHYTTLWEILMKEFHPEIYQSIQRWLRSMDAGLKDKVRSEEMRASDLEIFHMMVKECRGLGLGMSAMSAEKLIELYSRKTICFGDIQPLTKEFSVRLIDEMVSRKFFTIEPDKELFLFGHDLFGENVAIAFPSAIIDIEEAGKCFALERWTASVFHLMRVMELGLRLLGDTLNLSQTSNRNWDAILKKCDDELKKPFANKSLEWQTDEQFFAGASSMLRSVKDAWRNPTMHVATVYTEEQAQDIWNTVKAFMRLLATKLKEETPIS